MDEEKRIVILGAGESGVGAALLAKARGYVPFVSDAGKIKSRYKKILFEHSISLEEGRHNEQFLITADEVVKSPGIPDDAPIMKKIREKDIPVVSDIEFASRFTNAKIVAITGTNGKTTTAMLTYYLLKEAGLNVCLAGNVGISFAQQVIDNAYDYYVLEISSFQLDHIKQFRPDIAILLNITPDHLDRYGYNFDQYVRSKFRIVENMTPEDAFIYFSDDPVISAYLEQHPVKPYRMGISLHSSPDVNAFMNATYLKFDIPVLTKNPWKVNMKHISLNGPHNMVNAMASIMAARLLRVSDRKLRNALKTFENVPHRLEMVAKEGGIHWVNDSKATNLDATVRAMESFSGPVIWIAGGVDKGNNYDGIQTLVRDKVKAIICLGKENDRITMAFGDHVPEILETDSMKKAVKKAAGLAEKGDVVLLSPACASFDLFKNYADRGDKFKAAVAKMMKKEITK